MTSESKETDVCIAVKTEFEYLYQKTMEYVKSGEIGNYKTLLRDRCAHLLRMRWNLQEQWNDIFIGQIRDAPRQGRQEFKHHADVKIRLPSDNETANDVKKEIADFLREHVDKEEYQLIEEDGTCTIYKI